MRFIAFALLGLAVLFILPGLGERDFWPGDEARYGGVARDMVTGTERLIPQLNGEVYGDKPPGYFWAVMGAAWLTGEADEGAARWPAAVAGVVMVVLCGLVAARATGAHAGFLSGLVLLASFPFAWQARFAQLDLLFAMFISLSALTGFRAQEESRPRWLPVAGFWLGLAVIVKGPLALLVLPLLLLWRVLGRPLKVEGVSFRHGWLWFVVLTLLPTLVWLGAVSLKEGGTSYILNDLIGRNIVERSQQGLAHERPWYFYLQRMPINLMPWVLFMPLLTLKSVRDLLGSQGRRLCGFSLLWVVLFLGVQSAFPGKRNVYTFIFYAPLAILFGHAAAAAVSAKGCGASRGWAAILVGLLSITTLVAGSALLAAVENSGVADRFVELAAEHLGRDLQAVWGDLKLPAVGTPAFFKFLTDMRMLAVLLIVAGSAGTGLLIRGHLDLGLDAVMIGLAAVLALACVQGAPWLDPSRSRRGLAERVATSAADRPLAVFRHTDEGLLYYVGGRLMELTGDVSDVAQDLDDVSRRRALHAAAEKASAAWLAEEEGRFLLIRNRDRRQLEHLVEGRHYRLVFSARVGSSRWYDLIQSIRGH